jgi:ribose 5-phosphate isomerase A
VDAAVAAKRAAGERAAALVEDGMTLGLGTGSTARWFIAACGRLVAEGMRLRGVPTSTASERQAGELGIPVVELGARGVDLAVDGADAVDPQLRLIKGAGGALLREKIVAAAAAHFVVVVDESKLCPRLAGRLPVELVPFGHRATLAALGELCGVEATLRQGPDGAPYRTDNGGLISDLDVGELADPEGLAAALEAIPGVTGHGLFLGMADRVLAARADGSVAEITAAS